MTLFFTADTHFGETRGIAIDRRPFRSVAEQDEALVANWNAAVAPGDTIWHLGDFGRMPRAKVEALLARLNGTKHLILGNNDPEATAGADGWASVGHYHELTVCRVDDAWHPLDEAIGKPGETRLLILFHYALRTWNNIGKGALDLHGHSHGKLTPAPRQLDVGVDPQGFAPLSLDAAMAKLLPRRRH